MSKATENLLHPYVLGFFQSRLDKTQELLHDLKKKKQPKTPKKQNNRYFVLCCKGDET